MESSSTQDWARCSTRWLRQGVGEFGVQVLEPLRAWTALLASQGYWGGDEGSDLLILTFSLPPPRWLSYLLLFILDLAICLITCLGLARRSKCLLAS